MVSLMLWYCWALSQSYSMNGQQYSSSNRKTERNVMQTTAYLHFAVSCRLIRMQSISLRIYKLQTWNFVMMSSGNY